MRQWPFQSGLSRRAQRAIDDRIKYFASGEYQKDLVAEEKAEKAKIAKEKAAAEAKVKAAVVEDSKAKAKAEAESKSVKSDDSDTQKEDKKSAEK